MWGITPRETLGEINNKFKVILHLSISTSYISSSWAAKEMVDALSVPLLPGGQQLRGSLPGCDGYPGACVGTKSRRHLAWNDPHLPASLCG